MITLLGIALILCSVLGGAFFHLFIWRVRRPDRVWPWRAWASFGGPALAGAGLLTGRWTVFAMGAGLWLLARIVRDGSLEHLDH